MSTVQAASEDAIAAVAKPGFAQRMLQRNKVKAEGYLQDPTKLQNLLLTAQRKAHVAIDSVGPLAIVRDQSALMWRMVRSWQQGKYKVAPKGVLISAVAALIYFVVPFDFLPDFILGTGLFDDAAVLAFVLRSVQGDLKKFSDWETVEEAKRIVAAEEARQAKLAALPAPADEITLPAIDSAAESTILEEIEALVPPIPEAEKKRSWLPWKRRAKQVSK